MHPSNFAYFHFVVIKASDGVIVGAVIDQKRRAQQYYRKWSRRSQKRNTDSAYDSVAYDLVKITLSESQAEAKE